MTKWWLASAGALVALPCGCATEHQDAPVAPALGAGWQCLATGSGLDAPGTIFRRDDRSGATFGTIDLSKEIGIKSAELAVGPVKTQFVTSLGLAANLFKLSKGATGTASAQLPKTYGVSAEYRDALKELTSDADAEIARKWFATYSARQTGFTYFYIREALATKDLSYTLGSDLIADLGGEAAVSQQLTVSLPTAQKKAAPATVEQYTVPLGAQGDARLEVNKIHPEVNGKRPYVLQMSFEKPLRVCFRAERLVQTVSGTGGSATYDLVPVATPLEISSYEPMR